MGQQSSCRIRGGCLARSAKRHHGDIADRRRLTPVAIAAEGLNLSVSDLLIERDIYYRADMSFEDRFGGDQARFRRDLARNCRAA